MKNLTRLMMVMMVFGSTAAFADAGLSDQLNDLKMPENTAPAAMKSESLYVAQPRYNELAHHLEIDMGGAKNFTGNGFLNQNQVELTARYHLTDRWDFAVSGAYGWNDFTKSANNLLASEGAVPDAAIVKWRADALVGYNLFYGKFRFSMDNVLYFDQYVAIGPGLVNTQYDTALAGVADVGVALWFGKNWTARIGAKSDLYNEKVLTGSSLAYHLLGHIDIGYLIGGESHYE